MLGETYLPLTEQFIIECANLLSFPILCYPLLKAEFLKKDDALCKSLKERSMTRSSWQRLYTWALTHTITTTELLPLIIWEISASKFWSISCE